MLWLLAWCFSASLGSQFWQQGSSTRAGTASGPAGAVLLLGLFPWNLIQVNTLLFALMVLITKNECLLQQEAE